VKDLSIDYTDDEDEDNYEVSELKPLVAAKRNQQNKSSHSLAKSSSPQVKEIKTRLCTNIVKIVGRQIACTNWTLQDKTLKNIPQMTFTKEIMKAFLHLFRLNYWPITLLLRNNTKNGKNNTTSATIVLNQAYKS